MDDATRQAQAFLSKFGLSLDRLQDCVGEIAPWEAVVLGGSIPEGLANQKSDIDLLLLGDKDLPGKSPLPPIQAGGATIAFRPNLGSLRVQIETVHIAHLERLSRQMTEVAADFEDPEKAERVRAFGELDLRTIHRICTGVRLKNEAVAEAWKARLRCDLLPSYLLASQVAQQRMALEDAAGEWEEGRRESALWAMQRSLQASAMALLASVGETNPNSKWCVRLLQIHRGKAGPELCDDLIEHLIRPASEDLAERFRAAESLCERVVGTALSRDPVVVARREKMLGVAQRRGVSLPGSVASQALGRRLP